MQGPSPPVQWSHWKRSATPVLPVVVTAAKVGAVRVNILVVELRTFDALVLSKVLLVVVSEHRIVVPS